MQVCDSLVIWSFERVKARRKSEIRNRDGIVRYESETEELDSQVRRKSEIRKRDGRVRYIRKREGRMRNKSETEE